MSTENRDRVRRALREFRRFAGDGISPAVSGALPIGDPASGPHNPAKSELREALEPLAEGLDTIAQAVPAVQAAQATGVAAVNSARDQGVAAVTQARLDAQQAAEVARTGAEVARAGAEAAQNQAELAAIAAGAKLFATVAAGLSGTTDGDVFLVQAGVGTTVYRNDSGSEESLGWLGEILFANVTSLLADADNTFAPGTIIRTREEGFAYEVLASGGFVETLGGVQLSPSSTSLVPRAFGARADGATYDDAAFASLQSAMTGRVINLEGLTYRVTARPTGNIYVNGNWLTDNAGELVAFTDPVTISAASDTGGGENPAYTGGPNNTPTIPGRTTPHLRVVIGSQDCRSQFARSGNYSSIYSWAYGNVSGNYSARQSVAACPQSVNTASEECFIEGFRGFHAGSIFSEMVASTGVTIGSRFGFNSGVYSGIYSSNTVRAGFGRRARLTPVITDGVVTSITIDAAGDGYTTADSITVIDRQAFGTGATATIASVDGSGAITGITVTNGGANYGPQTVAYVVCEGEQIAVIASELSRIGQGENLAAIATRDVRGRGTESALIASTSLSSTAQGFTRQSVIASNAATTSANGAVVLSGVSCDAEHEGAVVIGRRTKSASARSIVFGDATSGSASTANRKFQVTAAGNVTAAGTITGSTTFTDYAEFFENAELGVIPLGTIVALDGRKVRPAQAGDDILGVVSATALVVAGDSPFTWAQRFMTGEFGEILYHDIPDPDWEPMVSDPEWPRLVPNPLAAVDPGAEPFIENPEPAPLVPNPTPQPLVRVAVENPDYDPTRENVPRSERPAEWTCVGLLGQVYVRVAEDVEVGDFLAGGDNGLGLKAILPHHIKEVMKYVGLHGIQVMRMETPYDATRGFAVAKCLIR